MAAVELLPAGVQLTEGVGDAVDVSAHARLTLNIDARATDMGSQPELIVRFDTSRAAAGPWVEFHREQLHAGTGVPVDSPVAWNVRRVQLAGFDDFVRVRWSSRFTSTLSFGIAGEGV